MWRNIGYPGGNENFAQGDSLGIAGGMGLPGGVDILPGNLYGLDVFLAGTFLELVVLEGCDLVNAASLAPASRFKLGH
jgi:hypothetical protein